jgi:hypothetical protein
MMASAEMIGADHHFEVAQQDEVNVWSSTSSPIKLLFFFQF